MSDEAEKTPLHLPDRQPDAPVLDDGSPTQPVNYNSPEIEAATSSDEVAITFYATVDADGSVETEADLQEEIRVLLPAWSNSTVDARISAQRTAPPPEPPQTHSRRRGCVLGAIAALIVFSLLGSSIFSVYWFWNQRSERLAEIAALSRDREAERSDNRDSTGDEPQSNAPVVAPSTPQARVDRIVFVNEERQIEAINRDGSGQNRLTRDAKSYSFPAWSPDGSRVAAVGSALNGGGVYLMRDVEEFSEPETLHFSESDFPFYLYWSPDSEQITFLANDRRAGLSLNAVQTSGEDESRVIALGSPLYWNWTADSEHMLVHLGEGTDNSELMYIDEFGRQRAPRVPAPGPFQAPGVSPSGRYWAYSQFQTGGTTWLVIEDQVNGDENRRRHSGSVAFNWSPTTDRLAFISGESDGPFAFWGPLRLMDAATGEIRLLSSDIVLAFFWSPDGSKIATISVPGRSNLGEQFEVRLGKDRRLTRHGNPTAVQQPRSHTFRVSVIDVESGQGLQLVEAALSASFLTQFLPFFDQYALSHQIWSPDSDALVLPLVNGRRNEISIVETRNGNVTPLVGGTAAFWSRQ